MNLTYWLVVFILIFSIFEMLRRNVLEEKYAIVWLFLGTTIIVGAIFPETLYKLSRFMGFQVLSNFVLFFFGLINLLIVMQLSLTLGKSEKAIQELAQEIGLLKSELEELQSK